MNGITRIEQCFNQGKVFVGYLTAGDGGMQRTLNAALALIDGGINLLEIGVPFSDPIADGPVIQRAAARALAQGTTLEEVLWLTAEIRKHSTVPLILFTYLNPILQALSQSFMAKAQQAGIDGLLLVDCPLEESAMFREQCLQHDIAPVYVLSPTTTAARMQKMDNLGRGVLYYACRCGITGMRSGLPEDFAEKIQVIKSIVRLPVMTGFGIASAETANEVLRYTDGVVVGSLFVKALEDGISPSGLTELAQSLRNALGE